jgi:hypothetical protein
VIKRARVNSFALKTFSHKKAPKAQKDLPVILCLCAFVADHPATNLT